MSARIGEIANPRRVKRKCLFWNLIVFTAYFLALSPNGVPAQETAPAPPPRQTHGDRACLAIDNYFLDEVWAKVGERTCLKCHKAEGDASESRFLLQDVSGLNAAERANALASNHAAFARMAELREGERSRLLMKIAGELDHGGGEVLKPDSTGYRIVDGFVRRVEVGVPPADSAPLAEQVAGKQVPMDEYDEYDKHKRISG